MSKPTFIQQIIEKNKKAIVRRTAQGLIVLGLATGTLTACDTAMETDAINKNTSSITETYGTNSATEPSYNNSTNSATNNSTDSTDNIDNVEIKHSNTFYNAKERWSDIWEAGRPSENVRKFVTEGAPFKFLAKHGVVYYNEDDQPRVYGDDDCNNDLCLETKTFIDINSQGNDFYLLVQYIDDGDIEFNQSAEVGTVISTWMLKYTLSDQCYQDLLLLDGDFRQNLLIQQIDNEYEPEVVSHTVVNYNFVSNFCFYTKIQDAVSNQNCIFGITPAVNYIESVDFENMEITVNYNLKNNPGKIYSYTFKVSESSQWINKLSEDQRNSATWEQVMAIRETPMGYCLDDVRYRGVGIFPDDEQKRSAALKYDFQRLFVNSAEKSTQFNKYELGQIPFSQVNNLTRQYAAGKDLKQ